MNTTTPQAQENLKSAFPYSYIDNTRFGVDVTVYDVGMTLRDYFAAKALNGILTAVGSFSSPGEYAKTAYKIADAMVAARAKEKT